MYVKELIEILKKFPEDYNVCVIGNGKGRSPFYDITNEGIYESEDCELSDVEDAGIPFIAYKYDDADTAHEHGTKMGEIKQPEEGWYDYTRKVVVLCEVND